MKNIKKLIACISVIFTLLIISGCHDELDQQPYSELAPGNFLSTEEGMNSVLASSYSEFQMQGFGYTFRVHTNIFTCGTAWPLGGGWEGGVGVPLTDFTWDASSSAVYNIWVKGFTAIRDANEVLRNLEKYSFSDDFKNRIKAEAMAIRGAMFNTLYTYYGTYPIITEDSDLTEGQPLASDEAARNQIESDLTTAQNLLPVDMPWGHADKGGVMGVLCKYYLNTKQWQKAADMASDIIALNKYELLPDYADIYHYFNEGNKEFLWAIPKTTTSFAVGLHINALGLPPSMGIPTWGARVFFFDDFVNSFHPDDKRKDQILTTYTVSGNTVDGLGQDKSISLKYIRDVTAPGTNEGNDVTLVRYADILLARAEALNELNGPSQEAINLIDQVRARAGIPLLGDPSGFNQGSLRDLILEERKFEFYYEDKRREDLIRHGKFISQAVSRGKNATQYHIYFPVPQAEVDANDQID